MTTWPSVPFGDLYAVPSRNGVYKPAQLHGSGTQLINMGELFAYDFLSDQASDRVELTSSEQESAAALDGDLLFGRRSVVEAGAGKCSLVVEPTEPLTYESSIIRVRLNRERANPRFYFYYFKSPPGRGRIRAIVTGTSVKGIRGSELARVSVARPARDIQDRIADILSNYDDLIENNRRRIGLLEKAAQMIYREWFVRLRFPGHEEVKTVDGLPEGWERKRLRDVATVNQASLKSGYQGEIEYIDISSVEPGRITETTMYDFRQAPSRARRIVRHGDIIWSCVRPNRKAHAVIWNPVPNLVASTGFAVITPKTVSTSYLYLASKTEEFVGHLVNRAKGVAYPAVVAADFEEMPLMVPSGDVVDQFDLLIQPILHQSHILDSQNRKLQQARDILLPRLMSGEIEVQEAASPDHAAELATAQPYSDERESAIIGT